MERLNYILKTTLLVAVALIIATAIGGNGCLWNGHSDNGNMVGSSGLNQATSPNPANGAANVAVNITLSWLSVSGMTSYNINLSTSNPPTYLTNVPNQVYRTTYLPSPVLQYNTTYYWRVDSKDSLNNTYIGYLWTFSTAAPVYVITGANPASGSANVPVAPTLSWTAVNGATSYNVYFGLSSNPPYVISTTSTTYSPASLSYNTIYYWKIAAYNGATLLVTGSVWNFTTVAVITKAASPNPTNNSVNIAVNPTLSWASGTADTNYDVNFGAISPPSFTANIRKQVYRTSYALSALSYSTTYYWRIDTRNDSGGLVLGDIWQFTTASAAPARVTNPNPADGAANVLTTTSLSWTASPLATSYNVYFGTTLTPPYRTNTVGTTYAPGTLAYVATYYWQINPKNSTGITTGAVWSFTTAAQALPAQATGPYPTSGTTNYLTTIQPSWLSGSDATSYDVYFGTGTPPPLAVSNLAKAVYRTSFNPGTLLNFTTYYWQVNARNSGGVTPGVIGNFITLPQLPGQVSSPNPASGTMDTAKNLTLSWGAASLADSYDIYFSATSTIVLGDKKLNTTGLVYTPSGLAYNTTYYWRVDSRNANGAQPGQVWNFTTLRPPEQVTTIAPVNNEPAWGIANPLTWNSATRATNYNVYFGITDTPILPLYANVTGTSYLPPMSLGMTYYWRIDAMNDAGTTRGIEQIFGTALPTNPPDVVTSGTPVNNATDVALSGTVLTGDTAYGAMSYDVYFGTTPTPVFVMNVMGTSYNASLTGGVTYYWQINSKNVIATVPGPIWQFTTMGLAALQSPANGDNAAATATSLTWIDGTNVTTSTLYLSASQANVQNRAGAANLGARTSPYTPGAPFAAGTSYWWTVDSVNTTGGVSLNPAVYSFTTLAGLASGPNPTDGQSDVSINTSLQWTAGANVSSYTLYFSMTQTDVTSRAVAANQGAQTSGYTPLTLNPGVQYWWTVDSVNSAGGVNQNPAIWSFTTLPIPGLPVLSSPLDSATNVISSTVLNWSAATKTATYNIYLQAGHTPPSYLTNVAGTITSYSPTLVPGSTYYWQIGAVNASGQTKSVIWSFSVLPLPLQASNPNPPTNATGLVASQTLSWTGDVNAASYNIYFGTSVTPPFIGNQAGTTYVPTLGVNTTYYWRVDSVNSSGTTTGAVWNFATLSQPFPASFVSPADGAIGQLNNVTLNWTDPSSLATSFNVYFDVSPTLTPRGNQVSTTYTPSPLLFWHTIYNWRIDSVNGIGTTTGAVWTFTTLQQPAQVANPVPSDAAGNIMSTQVLSWSAAARADSYDVYFDKTTNPPVTKVVSGGTGTSYAATITEDGSTYYWQVNAINAAGTTTGVVWSFTSYIPSLGKATLPNPADLSTNVAANITLAWTAGTGATSYDIYMGTTASPTYLTNQAGTTFTPGALDYNTTYYWRVDSRNSTSVVTGDLWSFTTAVSSLGQAVDNTTLQWTTGGTGISGASRPWIVQSAPFTSTDTPNPTIYPVDSYYGGSCARSGLGLHEGQGYGVGNPPDNGNYNSWIQTSVIGPGTLSFYWNVSSEEGWDYLTFYLDGVSQGAICSTTTYGTGGPTGWALKTYSIGSGTHILKWQFAVDSNTIYGDNCGWLDEVSWTGSPLITSNKPTVTTNPATNVTGNSAVLNGLVNPNGLVTTAYFQWGTTGNYDNTTTYQAVGSGTSNVAVSATVGSLLQSTGYNFRLVAFNADGTTTGTSQSFITMGPPPKVTGPTPADNATNVPKTTAQISWASSLGALSYDVYFGIVQSDVLSGTGGTSQGNQPGIAWTLPTLTYGQQYFWRIDAVNAGGTSTGDVWNFTLEGVPTGPPAQVTLLSPFDGSGNVAVPAQLSWSPAVGATSYKVYCDTNASPSALITTTIGVSYAVSGLANSTLYYWRIDSSNSFGDTASLVWSFTTTAAYSGTGADGALDVTGIFNLNTSTSGARTVADGWAARVQSLTTNSATLFSAPPANTFANSDEVILISVKGDPTGYSNVGNYEFLRVSSVVGSTVNFTSGKVNYYGTAVSSDTGVGTNQYVILQRVPNYTDVTVNASSSITCNPWNGTTGGVIAFRANGTLTLSGATAKISANGLGHQGGLYGQYNARAWSGETYFADSFACGGDGNTSELDGLSCPGGGAGGSGGNENALGTANIAGTQGPAGGGGGGAIGSSVWGMTYGMAAGGGGGGYGSEGLAGMGYLANGSDGSGAWGGDSGVCYYGSSNSPFAAAAGGGGLYGNSTNLNTKAFFGAGGGGGGGVLDQSLSYMAYTGGSGGAGGGLIYIAATTITNNGAISANGANGQFSGSYGESDDFSDAGGGGGGAGGSVIIVAGTFTNPASVTVTGGGGGWTNWGDDGGTGGAGRTYIKIGTNAPIVTP